MLGQGNSGDGGALSQALYRPSSAGDRVSPQQEHNLPRFEAREYPGRPGWIH